MSQGAEQSSGADSGDVDPQLLALLRCPCQQHQPLQQRPEGLACSGCERVFSGGRRHPGDPSRAGR